MKKKSKKINPRQRPVNMADVRRAETIARDGALISVTAMLMTVMRDKHGFGRKRLMGLWKDLTDISDSVKNGYVSIDDLIATLDDEAGIEIR